MPYSIIRPVFLILLVMLGACRPVEVAEEPEAVTSNEALRQLYEADQQDRADWEQKNEEQYAEQDSLLQRQPIDITRVTDQERQRLGVFPLQQTRAILHCTNTEENMTLGDCMIKQLEQNAPGSDG